MFNSWKKAIELDSVISNRYFELLKKILLFKSDEYVVDHNDLTAIVLEIEDYYDKCVTAMCQERNIDETKSILDILEEPVEDLLQKYIPGQKTTNNYEEFSIRDLYERVDSCDNKLSVLFKDNDQIRKDILNIVLYDLIRKYGKSNGPERALLLSKLLPGSTSSGIAMQYATYSNRYDEKFIRFLKVYLQQPTSTESIYWIPSYFDGDKKTKYCVEELHDVIDEIESVTKVNIRSNGRQKSKI